MIMPIEFQYGVLFVCYDKYMLNKSQRQNGSVQVVIAIILVIAIVGALGFVAWGKFSASESSGVSSSSNEHTPVQTTASDPITDPNEGYLVIKDWNIKFKLPEDSGEVHYYKESVSDADGVFEYYQLSTKRVEGLGGRCAPDAPEGQIGLGAISRQTTRREDLMSAVATNNNEPIGGYYYYASGGQSTCGDEHIDWQTTDRSMTFNMLRAPIALN